jgi:hypothetical protein
LNIENTSKNSFNLYEMLKEWGETQATFLHSAKNVQWAIPGAAGIDTDRGSTVLGSITAPKKGLVTIVLNNAGIAVVQEWISDPVKNHGVILQDFTDTSKDNLSFSSKENSKSNLHPKLSIQFLSLTSLPASPLRTSALRNLENPFDVNADENVTPLDALLVINQLNNRAAEGEDDSTNSSVAVFLDVSGDGSITPMDALLVINNLNADDESFLAEGEFVVAVTLRRDEARRAEEDDITSPSPTPILNLPISSEQLDPHHDNSTSVDHLFAEQHTSFESSVDSLLGSDSLTEILAPSL